MNTSVHIPQNLFPTLWGGGWGGGGRGIQKGGLTLPLFQGATILKLGDKKLIGFVVQLMTSKILHLPA